MLLKLKQIPMNDGDVQVVVVRSTRIPLRSRASHPKMCLNDMLIIFFNLDFSVCGINESTVFKDQRDMLTWGGRR